MGGGAETLREEREEKGGDSEIEGEGWIEICRDGGWGGGGQRWCRGGGAETGGRERVVWRGGQRKGGEKGGRDGGEREGGVERGGQRHGWERGEERGPETRVVGWGGRERCVWRGGQRRGGGGGGGGRDTKGSELCSSLHCLTTTAAKVTKSDQESRLSYNRHNNTYRHPPPPHPPPPLPPPVLKLETTKKEVPNPLSLRAGVHPTPRV